MNVGHGESEIRRRYMARIAAATKGSTANESETVEEAMAMCLATIAIAHRRIPFTTAFVESTATAILKAVDDSLESQ